MSKNENLQKILQLSVLLNILFFSVAGKAEDTDPSFKIPVACQNNEADLVNLKQIDWISFDSKQDCLQSFEEIERRNSLISVLLKKNSKMNSETSPEGQIDSTGLSTSFITGLMANKFGNNAQANLWAIRKVPVLEQLKKYEIRLLNLASEYFSLQGKGNLDELVKNLNSYSQVSKEAAEFLTKKGSYLDHSVYAKFQQSNSEIEKIAKNVNSELSRLNESSVRYRIKNSSGSIAKNLQSLVELNSKWGRYINVSDLNSYKAKFKANAAAAGVFGAIALHQILTAFPAGRLFLANMSFGDLSVEDAFSKDVNREKVCDTIVQSHKNKKNITNGIYNSIECVAFDEIPSKDQKVITKYSGKPLRVSIRDERGRTVRPGTR